jgi:hypothetical protein
MAPQQTRRSADKRAAAFVEAQQTVRGLTDANTGRDAKLVVLSLIGPINAGAGSAGPSSYGAEPKRAGRAKIRAIEPAIDLQGLSQTPGAACQVKQTQDATMDLHLFDAFQGLQGANQDPAADARKLAADIEHKVIAVAEINVGVAATQKHGAGARRWPAKMMGGWVLRGISLGFDDTTGQPIRPKFADDDFANQGASQGNCRDGELATAEAANRDVQPPIVCDST